MELREEMFEIKPYQLNKDEKKSRYKDILKELTCLHYDKCEEYKRFINKIGFKIDEPHELEEYPFLPVRVFKELDLKSVPMEDVVKIMTSSGTTGQNVSKIYLDKVTSSGQTTALVKIVADMLGGKRFPMLVIDTASVIKDRKMFSARGAGIIGFSTFGRDMTYALDDDMNMDFEVVEDFLKKHEGKQILLFGFTYIIWQHFYKALKESDKKIDLSNAILLHGGGFKKLEAEAIDNETYKQKLKEVCGISRVCNYYGMVEQTGSIFMECECGHIHASNYSDIIIRNPKDFTVCKNGEVGLIQLVSVLPKSYPGHSILSEDLGCITGEDDCPCGRKGKTFRILGRIKKAEVRGCSDTYESK